jgi:phosphoribosylformimino-5-aminoimidazole carboxamide ribonucleotide (ProFAR) isomerase
VIASGGVSRREDLAALAAEPGIVGVIVGRALYTGDVVLGPDDWAW